MKYEVDIKKVITKRRTFMVEANSMKEAHDRARMEASVYFWPVDMLDETEIKVLYAGLIKDEDAQGE